MKVSLIISIHESFLFSKTVKVFPTLSEPNKSEKLSHSKVLLFMIASISTHH